MRSGVGGTMSDTALKRVQVLVVGQCDGVDDLLEGLPGKATVVTAPNWADAAQALKNKAYDVIIADGNALRFLMNLRRPTATSEAKDPPSVTVLSFNDQGQVIGMYPAGAPLPDDLQQAVELHCFDLLSRLRISPSAPPASQRFELTRPSGEVFELVLTPILDTTGGLRSVTAAINDMTRARSLQTKIDAIDRAGHELVRIDPEQLTKLQVPERLALLEQKVMRYAHDLMHFDHIAVFVLNRKTNRLELALSSGMPQNVRGIDLYAKPEGNGICGYVASTGNSYLCHDVTRDPYYLQGLGNARSSLTVPLTLADQMVGVFNVESERPSAFTEEDRQFAEIFARYVAMALHTLELLVTERHTMTGQLRQDVRCEVLAPINDLFTELETLKEDYIGMDDLRQRLGRLSENVIAIRDAFSRITAPQTGVIVPRDRRAGRFDPVLNAKRILIADDEDVIRDTVRDVLLGYGCEVTVAHDGQEAVDRIAEKTFDLVLSDIRLPGRNGYEIFAAARAANPSTAVILMTGFGYDPNHSLVRANSEGLNAVLFKPFKIDELLGEMRTAMKAATS